MPDEPQQLSLGMHVPDFSANTTLGPISLSDYRGKWVILFSHPGDFTPVCTTEFLAFAQADPEFVQRKTQLIGLSFDSNASHLAWIQSLSQNYGVQIPFPIISDPTGSIARLYGMTTPESNHQEAVRSVYFIDPSHRLRAFLMYPSSNGRSIPELIRLLDALQTTDSRKVVTPVNWQPGDPVMIPAPRTLQELSVRTKHPESVGLSCKDWYLCYQNTSSPPPSM